MALDNTNPQLTTRQINQITRRVTTVAELLGGLLEVELRQANGSYQSAGLPTGILFQALAQQLPGPNDRKDLRKTVRCFDLTTPEYLPGDATLTGLPIEGLCLATECDVGFSPAGFNKKYKLIFDATGPLQVYADGRFTGPKAPARWVLLGSEEEASTGIDTFSELTDRYARGKQVIALLPGSAYARLFELQPQDQTKTEILRSQFPNSRMPAPTGQPGDIYWVERPLSMPGYVGFQVIGLALARAQVAPAGSSQELNPPRVTPGRFYRVQRYAESLNPFTRPDPAEYDVLLLGVTPTSYALQQAVQIDNTTDKAVAVGTYDLVNDEFTPGAGGAGLTPEQLLRLPAATPDSTILWVEPGGQTEAGVIGNRSRPFPSLSAAHTAATNGSRIVLLAGVYAEAEVIIRKNVRVDCEPGVVFTGSVLFGAFGTAQPFASSLCGGEFTGTGRLVIIRQNSGASTFTWQDGRLSGSAYVWAWSGNSTGTHTDEIRLTGIRGRTTVSTAGSQASSGVGHRGLTVGARTDGTQRQRVIVDDSALEVTNGEAILFQAHPDTRVVLRGATRMDGTAQSRTLPLVPSGQQLAEVDWLMDERVRTSTTSAQYGPFTSDGTATQAFGPLPEGVTQIYSLIVRLVSPPPGQSRSQALDPETYTYDPTARTFTMAAGFGLSAGDKAWIVGAREEAATITAVTVS